MQRFILGIGSLILILLISIGVVMAFTTYSDTDSLTSDLSVQDILERMATAHTRYDQLHVQYNVDFGGDVIQHEVWLDTTTQQFRHENRASDDTMQLKISDGTSLYTNPGPMGFPITGPLLTSPDSTLANQWLGGIGTMISPVFAVENRLGASDVVLEGIETYEIANLTEPLTVARLSAQFTDFPANSLWVDVDTGIIVQERLYYDDGSLRSVTTLEWLDMTPDLNADLFIIPE